MRDPAGMFHRGWPWLNHRFLLPVGWLAWLLCSPIAGAAPRAPESVDFSQTRTLFHGPGQAIRPDSLPPTIKIGLLAPERTEEGRALRQAVELALVEANAAGGWNGRPFELIFRAEDGAWGRATPRIVELAHAEQVWAILGGIDGHHAHLAELVAAKFWVPVVVTWAMDRTIDYANVPWVFRCTTDDGHQAEELLRWLGPSRATDLLILREDERDARAGSERVAEAAQRLGWPRPAVAVYSPLDPTRELPWPSLLSSATEPGSVTHRPVLLWGQASGALRVGQELRARGWQGPLLAPALLANALGLQLEGLVVAAPFDLSAPTPGYQDFARRYQRQFGAEPPPLAARAYDAAQLTLQAIRMGGLNRAHIREALVRSDHLGITGRIRFEALRGNPAKPILLEAHEGRWIHAAPAPE